VMSANGCAAVYCKAIAVLLLMVAAGWALVALFGSASWFWPCAIGSAGGLLLAFSDVLFRRDSKVGA
jgi:hypothetical protein